MAMYEQSEAFDELEDEFLETEEGVTTLIAGYVDEHLELFAKIVWLNFLCYALRMVCWIVAFITWTQPLHRVYAHFYLHAYTHALYRPVHRWYSGGVGKCKRGVGKVAYTTLC